MNMQLQPAPHITEKASPPKKHGSRALRFVWPLLTYGGAFISFTSKGWLCFLPLVVTWVLMPLAELLLPPDRLNLSDEEEAEEKGIRVYDYLLYGMVLLQVPTLFLFFHSLQDPALQGWEKAGRIATMGLFCGTSAVNVGHELGHRTGRLEKVMANISLLTTLYMHYLIEHIKGHHKIVATHQDPSSARYGEVLYAFWVRCFVYGYLSAWKIAIREQKKKGRSAFGPGNEMLRLHLIQGAFVLLVYALFGAGVLGCFLLSSAIGILLFESVSYIEHYGLTRKEVAPGRMERILPVHSWDSDHILGRILLFNSPRHSDHHYLASRKYQVLRHHAAAPQMPTGYPGMILLALVPPAFFYVMNPKVRALEAGAAGGPLP